MMFVEPVSDVDHRYAKKNLASYLKSRHLAMDSCHEWTRWTYGDVPFWSVWGRVYDVRRFIFHDCGVQVYDDGRVEIFDKTGELEL